MTGRWSDAPDFVHEVRTELRTNEASASFVLAQTRASHQTISLSCKGQRACFGDRKTGFESWPGDCATLRSSLRSLFLSGVMVCIAVSVTAGAGSIPVWETFDLQSMPVRSSLFAVTPLASCPPQRCGKLATGFVANPV